MGAESHCFARGIGEDGDGADVVEGDADGDIVLLVDRSEEGFRFDITYIFV